MESLLLSSAFAWVTPKRSWSCCLSIPVNRLGSWNSNGPVSHPLRSSAMHQFALPATGKGVVYPVRDGDKTISGSSISTVRPENQLTDFKSELIRDFDWSFDGKQLAVIRGHSDADVVLIRDSEK